MDGKSFFDYDPALFEFLPESRPTDWLAGPGRDERERSFEDYVRSASLGRTEKRRVIVLQPLGEFSAEEVGILELVRQYSEIFFDVPTRLERSRPLPKRGLRGSQYLATAIMQDSLMAQIPPDAICCLGITMEDLYPGPGWNFVFSAAYLKERVGVYSLARYRSKSDVKTKTARSGRRMLLRSVKLMVHETVHMFGLHHCRKYRCLENGANHVVESDRRPVFLCPDCLRKLQWNLKFDVAERYLKMLRFWEKNGFPEQADWLKRRLGLPQSEWAIPA